MTGRDSVSVLLAKRQIEDMLASERFLTARPLSQDIPPYSHHNLKVRWKHFHWKMDANPL